MQLPDLDSSLSIVAYVMLAVVIIALGSFLVRDTDIPPGWGALIAAVFGRFLILIGPKRDTDGDDQ